jgi:hypothetical protein
VRTLLYSSLIPPRGVFPITWILATNSKGVRSVFHTC